MQIILALLILAIPSMPHQSIVIHAADTVLPTLKAQEEKIYDIEEYGIPEPKAVKLVQPDYPEIARRNRQNGFVILEVIVDKKGHVAEVQVVRIMPKQHSDKLKRQIGSEKDLKAIVAVSSVFTEDTYGFGKEAAKAVIQWQLKPSLYNGEVVPIRLLLSVEFDLAN